MGHVVCMADIRTARKILGSLKGRDEREEDDIEVYLKEILYDNVDCIDLAVDDFE